MLSEHLQNLMKWCMENFKSKEACEAMVEDVKRLYAGIKTVSGRSWFKLSKDYVPIAVGGIKQGNVKGIQIIFMSSKGVLFRFAFFENGMSGYSIHFPESEIVDNANQLFEN
jgi:hypothetical protein